MEVIADPTQEEAPQVIVSVQLPDTPSCTATARVVDDHVLLILGEETSHLASHQNLVDEFQEGFLLDLGVGEDERNLLALQASHLVQGFEILEQVGLVVLLRDCNLERERSDDVRGESGQRLLTGAADTNQQGAASLHA